MTIDKCVEVSFDDQIDRYRLIGIPVDNFIDTFLVELKDRITFKDISEQEYESEKFYELELDVEGQFKVTHYVKKHPNKECEREWIDFVRQIRKNSRRDNDQV